METYHPEGGKSPFIPEEELSDPASRTEELDGAGDGYVECPIEGCNEVLVRDELDYHLELHSGEAEEDGATRRTPTPTPDAASQAQNGPHSAQPLDASNGNVSEGSNEPAPKAKQQSTIAAWRNILAIPGRRQPKNTDTSGNTTTTTTSGAVTKRMPIKLGKAELGRYHDEKRMPDWLVAHLQKYGQVVGKDVIPVLEQLLEQSPTTSYAYLCHSCAWHVSKLRREGGFCGYRNIQMLSSYIIGAEFEGSQHFKGKLPSIFDIQESIEGAWDKGINKQGRVETGGVRGSRKYIGTPEAQAMFVSLGVPCEAQGFKNREEAGKAEALLLVSVERYFQQGVFESGNDNKVRRTKLPPIYFQHAGHSMTIVGIDKDLNGAASLLVFDPMFRDSAVISERVGRKFTYKYPDHALKAYRRGHSYLKRYREFEVLRLVSPPRNEREEEGGGARDH